MALIERNRAHLQRHGLEDVDLLAVSSVLHLVALAQGDAELERESGFAALFDAVHRQVWVPARRNALADAGRQLADLADHVAAPLEAEREALRSPAEAERTLTRLAELEDRVRQVRSASARWQQRLAEGAQDASGDLDHELRDRFRALARTADARVDADGSADDLAFEAWLHKATMDEVVAHYDRIRDRMTVLSDEVAAHFLALDRSAAYSVESDAPSTKLAGLSVSREQSGLKDGVLRRLVTTGQGYSSGIVLTSSVLGVFGGTFLLIPALALPIAGLMARRAFVDDRDRKQGDPPDRAEADGPPLPRRGRLRRPQGRAATRYARSIVRSASTTSSAPTASSARCSRRRPPPSRPATQRRARRRPSSGRSSRPPTPCSPSAAPPSG